MAVTRLVSFSLTTGNLERLAAFYRDAFGCQTLAREIMSGPDFESLMGVSAGAQRMMLGLGHERIELLQFERPGQPYPQDSASSDLFFQHFAIVVAHMDQAFEQLSRAQGWTSISMSGPQRLPAQSGGVTAFKFRDPDGHPLELLAFPSGQAPPAWQPGPDGALCSGIDHSAISVADSARSIAFYEALGLCVSARSLNRGSEQARLDDVPQPQVEVTALALSQGGPHLELLCYRGVKRGEPIRLRNNDMATTRLILETTQPGSSASGARFERCLLDPDGHHLLLVPPAQASTQNG
jgi:catechol 2,3-dioxygenase-like lactoylglutathione lyase family enzyme